MYDIYLRNTIDCGHNKELHLSIRLNFKQKQYTT